MRTFRKMTLWLPFFLFIFFTFDNMNIGRPNWGETKYFWLQMWSVKMNVQNQMYRRTFEKLKAEETCEKPASKKKIQNLSHVYWTGIGIVPYLVWEPLCEDGPGPIPLKASPNLIISAYTVVKQILIFFLLSGLWEWILERFIGMSALLTAFLSHVKQS